MLGISPLLCTCQCLSTHLQPSLSCYLSIWHLTLSLLSLSILIPHHSVGLSMHICFLSLSLSLSLSCCCGDQTCLVCLSAVLCDQSGEWAQKREREKECGLVSQRPKEHAVPFWLGILKAQSHSCCLCVSSPWPHLYKLRPQSQLSNKPKIQCISIILSNSQGWDTTQSCVVSFLGRYLKLVMLSWDVSSAEFTCVRLSLD